MTSGQPGHGGALSRAAVTQHAKAPIQGTVKRQHTQNSGGGREAIFWEQSGRDEDYMKREEKK